MLIARTGYVYGVDLENFKQLLISVLVTKLLLPKEMLAKNISATTAHGSKGQEAHTVFILDATQRQFPKIHPDNLLFRPFGVSPKAVLDEERRLFYVAITRAEHRLYVLTEKGEESPYLYAFKVGLFDQEIDNVCELATFKRGSLAMKIADSLATCVAGETTSSDPSQK